MTAITIIAIIIIVITVLSRTAPVASTLPICNRTTPAFFESSTILDEELPIEVFANPRYARYIDLYDGLFTSLLLEIPDIRWHNYFEQQMEFMKANSIVVGPYSSCYYNGKMKIGHSEAMLNSGVILHEFGHFVFDKMLDKKEDAIIANIFKKEVAHFIKDEEYLMKLHQKYYTSITLYEMCRRRKYCPIMIKDGIGILTGESSLGIGHYSGYPIEHLSTELFAEVLEAEVLGYQIPITIYKKECPETYSYIRNKIYEVLSP